MLKLLQVLCYYALLLTFCCTLTARARPQTGETVQDADSSLDSEPEELRNAYAYDMPAQAIYPSIPMDRLQMLIAQYRPNAYLRAPTYGGMNELFRLPETKRQVRYRQCYFNPISCFKK